MKTANSYVILVGYFHIFLCYQEKFAMANVENKKDIKTNKRR